MDERRKKALRAASYELSRDMDSVQMVMTYLQGKEVLSRIAKENIEAKGARSTQVSHLIDHISARGNDAYDALRNALIQTEQQLLAEKLPLFDLPPQSPELFLSNIPEGENLDILDESLLQRIDAIHIRDDPDSVPSGRKTSELKAYPMTSQPIGLALIINNVDFTHMRRRNGSDVDADNLTMLLKAYNFQIFEEGKTRNLTRGKMEDVLLRFSQQRDHQKYSCSLVCVLTHGQNGFLFGTDSDRANLVSVEWMLGLFQGNKCPNLNGKPKIFLLQACRGEKMDSGANMYAFGDSPDSVGTSRPADDELYKELISQNYDETDAMRKATEAIASHSDIFVGYATVPGYVSWRNSEKGSWFIQAIVHVFPRNSEKEDLLSMMTEVNRLVANTFKSSSGDYKMVPSMTTQLTKKLFLPRPNLR